MRSPLPYGAKRIDIVNDAFSFSIALSGNSDRHMLPRAAGSTAKTAEIGVESRLGFNYRYRTTRPGDVLRARERIGGMVLGRHGQSPKCGLA